MKKSKFYILFLYFYILSTAIFAQNTTVRGTILDEDDAQPVSFALVKISHNDKIIGISTDENGFFQINNVSIGQRKITVSSIGFDSLVLEVNLTEGVIFYKKIMLKKQSALLQTVEISSQKNRSETVTQVSQINVLAKDIKALPSVGGTPDLVQYLTVLPGVVSSGDQGGQIYIRGGAPWQNKILLDGVTIYNPFHSIGLFSVFETETIRSADVLTGGFGAEYGGRIGAIVDVRTREGNAKRLAGQVSGSPFQAKILLEGPLVKMKDAESGSLSFMLTGKKSLLPETAKTLYKYANTEGGNLPFDYQDIYGKISFSARNGSKLNAFGFSFQDGVNYTQVSDLQWQTTGGGLSFSLIPTGLKMLVSGNFAASNYKVSLSEAAQDPRTSGVSSFNAGLNFTVFGSQSELKYGFDVSGFSTDFAFENPLGFDFEQKENTTELAAFARFRKSWSRVVIEPSLHVRNYSALGELQIEPRLAVKVNITEGVRFKTSGGLYSQNLISTTSEKDIVNLFVGFLSGPEERISKLGSAENTASRLQKAIHVIGGFEFDLGKKTRLNVEGYLKKMTQLIEINRLKTRPTDANYVSEEGEVYGADMSVESKISRFNLYFSYGLTFVNRFDGVQTYPTNFDRRHNANFLASYFMGKKADWEISARWNYGSGFPFTQTRGFFSNFPTTGVGTDVLTQNPDLGVIFSDKRNGGRLPDFHRLDVSIKKNFVFTNRLKLEAIASATNIYDRANIFYFDRIRYKRVNQLPILPSLALNFHF